MKEQCVGVGLRVATAENSSPCWSSHLSWAQHLWHQSPMGALSLRLQRPAGHSDKEKTIEQWMNVTCWWMGVCVTNAMCSGLHHRARDQELMNWHWHCHMAAGICQEIQQGFWSFIDVFISKCFRKPMTKILKTDSATWQPFSSYSRLCNETL